VRLLLVEDDGTLATTLQRALREEGYAVDWLSDGEAADEILATQDYDLVILDVSLPGLDGLGVLKHLRERGSKTPVLVLTARDRLDDRVTGLDLGADDYMTKPFELAELEARVRALIRRSEGEPASEIVHGLLTFDTVGRRVAVDGEAVDLRNREICVLEILLRHTGQVVSKERIADQLFDFDDQAGLTAIELYVHRLRKKLSPAGVVIRTVRGLGYLLDKP
jgi:DNA-binding response OmpR family regulator